MFDLENKLIDLGYLKDWSLCYSKNIIIHELQFNLTIFIKNNKIFDYKIFIHSKDGFVAIIKSQNDIHNLQLAFNQLQNDLEVLYEKKD